MNIKERMEIARAVGQLQREQDQLNGEGYDNNLMETIAILKRVAGMKLNESEEEIVKL